MLNGFNYTKKNVQGTHSSASGMEKKTVCPINGNVMEPGTVTMERMNRTVVSFSEQKITFVEGH